MIRAVLLLLVLAIAAPARADTIPDFKWEELFDENTVWSHLSSRIKRMPQEPTDFLLRVNVAKLSYILWRLEKDDNAKRMKLANIALKASQELIKLNPKSEEGYYWMGASLGMIGTTRGVLNSLQLLPELKKAFETAITINDSYIHYNAYAHMGHLYLRLPGFPVSIGDRAKGLEYLKKAIQKDPKDAIAYLYLADFYWMTNEPALAMEQLKKIFPLKADCPEQYFTLETSKRKAKFIIAAIEKGEKRDPLFDVTSDVPPQVVQ
jgi:tetratricopeptide (TPR) repeat protein